MTEKFEPVAWYCETASGQIADITDRESVVAEWEHAGYVTHQLFTAAQMRQARTMAFEEAAQQCEGRGSKYMRADECAERIRDLIEQESK